MVNVRDIKGKEALFKAGLGKSFGDFIQLRFFHCYNYICPGNIFVRDWFFVVESCRPGFKFSFKQQFSCLAPVLVLVADEQYLHDSKHKTNYDLNVAFAEVKT